MNTKTCTKCGIEKELTEFSVNEGGKFGVKSVCKKCVRIYYQRNKEKMLAQRRIYVLTHKAKIKELKDKYYQENKVEIRRRNNKYNKTHQDVRLNWRKSHRKELTLLHNRWQKEQIKNNPNFKIKNNLYSRIHKALNGLAKSAHTLRLLGCSINFLKNHLESQFKDGMSWENHGLKGWHIDHIYPCASFDLSKPEEQQICFHWSNMQPLWAKENIIKSDN